MKFRLSDLNADTIKKGFAHIRSTAIPEALSSVMPMALTNRPTKSNPILRRYS